MHCSIFKILLKQFFALQLLHYITFRSFCQVNILWTEVQPAFSFHSFLPWPAFLFYHILSILSSKQFMNSSSSTVFFSSTACPKQSAYSFYHTFTVLSSELFLNKFRSPLSISRSVLLLPFIPHFHSTPAPVRQLYYYIMLFSLCQVYFCEHRQLFLVCYAQFAIQIQKKRPWHHTVKDA